MDGGFGGGDRRATSHRKSPDGRTDLERVPPMAGGVEKQARRGLLFALGEVVFCGPEHPHDFALVKRNNSGIRRSASEREHGRFDVRSDSAATGQRSSPAESP